MQWGVIVLLVACVFVPPVQHLTPFGAAPQAAGGTLDQTVAPIVI